MFKKTTLVMLFMLLMASIVHAQDTQYSIWDWQHRTQISVSSAYLQTTAFSTEEMPQWLGVDVVPTITYSWHPLLSTYVSYACGFPFDNELSRINMVRAAFNFNVYPGISGERSNAALAIGYGALWLGNVSIKEWIGSEVHVTGAYKLFPKVASFVTYSHAFGTTSTPDDFDFLRAGLTCKLW